jgi:thymidine kinase
MITAILGPMYSGKSTMLYQKMERYYYAGKSIALIRPKLDSRGYFSHSIENRSVERIIKASSKNKEIRVDEFTTTLCMELRAYDAVFIDEYFMIKGCSLEAKMSQSNQNVFFAGLIASSENKLFPETIELLPYCDEIIKLNGVCMICGFYSEDGIELSDKHKITLNSSDDENRNRENKLRFTFKEISNKYSGKFIKFVMKKVIENSSEEPIYKTYDVKLQLAFFNDFDEF